MITFSVTDSFQFYPILHWLIKIILATDLVSFRARQFSTSLLVLHTISTGGGDKKKNSLQISNYSLVLHL